MRSLASKLTLAFVFVGVLGVVLFAVLIAQRTQVELRRFLSERDQSVLIESLNEYFESRGSWEGIQAALKARPVLELYSRSAVLADASGRIILSGPGKSAGEMLSNAERNAAILLSEHGQPSGYVLFAGTANGRSGGPPSAETDFLRRVMWAAIASAIATMGVALIVGGLLARTLTRPVTALTEATRAMAAGDLHQQVQVQSKDEIGELARSFNVMSADLAHASHTRKQMTADLAHELRTPLSILGGYAEGLKDGRVDGSPELFSLMYDEVLHLQRLVEDLRVLSLADAGELPLNRRTVDATALLERTYLAHVGRASDLNIRLTLQADEGLPSISVDTDRMAQVLNNLVSNALRHTGEGEVALRGRRSDGDVLLQVQDTGPGIAPEDLPFVFERFYRGDKARQREDGSTSGLGLAIARAIVETHGGKLTVESQVGHGATFTIRLPIAK